MKTNFMRAWLTVAVLLFGRTLLAQADQVPPLESVAGGANESSATSTAPAEPAAAESLPTSAESQPTSEPVRELSAIAPASAPESAPESLAASQPESSPESAAAVATTEFEQPVETPIEQPIHARGGLFGIGLVLTPKIGGGLSQIFFNGLGASFVGELELGYTLPLPEPVGRDIQLFLSGQYAGPSGKQTVTTTDARLPGDGTWQYELTMHQAVFTLGALYRIPVPLSWLRPYAGLGGRMYKSWTVVRGSAGGQAFGENLEQSTDFGAYGEAGADFFVGPGAIMAELQLGFTPINSFVMRDTNAGALNLAIGYRFFL